MANRKKATLRERVVDELNRRFCKDVNVSFGSDISGRLVSIGSRNAINSFDNDRELVQATRWFSDTYWYFIRIEFVPVKKDFKMFASVSFFQEAGENLKQLFRAEWDSYALQEGYNHPQPHWHFTAQLSDKTSFSDLENDEEESIFGELVGNSKTIKLDRMHFSMAGEWPTDGQMACELNDEHTLVDWLIYLFAHVRAELDYKDSKSLGND